MKHSIYALVLFMFTISVSAQIENVVELFALPNNLSESSGAIFYNDVLVTHTDSGGESKLYELDTISSEVTREVAILNANNVDWEDITQDENHIFIGDIGNNSGNRTDLKIYKINKTDYKNNEDVTAEIISFSYANQTDFSPNPNNTQWDAEALVAYQDNLVLYSKNWVDNNTQAYLIPKTPGTYSVQPLPNTFNALGLITGATFDPSSNSFFLVGYNSLLQTFVWTISNFEDTDIFTGSNTQTILTELGQEQAEAICFVGQNRFFLTSESFSFSIGSNIIEDYAKLIGFNDNSLHNSTFEELEINVFPNPASDILTIRLYQSPYQNIEYDIYDTYGRLVVKSKNQNPNSNYYHIDVKDLSEGVYVLKVYHNTRFITKKIVISRF